MKLKQKILTFFFRKELNRFLKAALFCSMKHMQDKWCYRNGLLPLEIQMVLFHTACISLPFYVYCFMTLSVAYIIIPSVIDEGMDMENRWNHGERRKPKYSEDTLTMCHFVHCSPHR